MRILVTGAKGFMGKNLIAQLKNKNYHDIYECDVDTTDDELDQYTNDAEFVFHLAGVNRPKDDDDFMKGNFGFTSVLLEKLKRHKNKAPIMLSSSIQAEVDNPYGNSKRAGEELLFDYAKEAKTDVFIYRFPNVFGKWCRPNYNSVIATFCYNVANDLPITIHNEETELSLVYIDDVVKELINALKGTPNKISDYCSVEPVHKIKLGEVAILIKSFKTDRLNLSVPELDNDLVKKMHATYLSYLAENDFAYDLKMNVDNRGSFTEFIKTFDRGQVSVNISNPGIVKGNHWHHTKNEKFLVVKGQGVIRFRKIGSSQVIEYNVTGDKLQVVDIPPGYTHNIENVGSEDMVTIMWANEPFDPKNPDTYYLEV